MEGCAQFLSQATPIFGCHYVHDHHFCNFEEKGLGDFLNTNMKEPILNKFP
jgi:hypothetical protein